MSETNVQLFPGVFRTTQGGSNPDFFLHSDGRVGIGNTAPEDRPAWDTDPASTATNKLNVTGHTHITGSLNVTGHLYGDGSTLSGVAAVVGGYWDLDQANNNIKYDIGNVGIGGAAGTEKLKVHGTVEATSFSGIQASDVPSLNADKITTGTLGTARIPTLSTSKISGLQNSATIEATTTSTANKIVMRNGNADIEGRYFYGEYVNISHNTGERNSDTVFYSSTDNYIRKNNAAGMRSSLGLGFLATVGSYPTVTQGDYRWQYGGTGTVSHANYGGYGDWYIRSNHSSGKVVIQDTGGNMGVGTSDPITKLHIAGSTSLTNSAALSYFNYNRTTLSRSTYGGTLDISVYASSGILTATNIVSMTGTITASDSRIKKEIVDVEDGTALETLRLLKPKQYKYVDELRRGAEPVWGFIAQEVRDTLPYATRLLKECIPSIYELADVSVPNTITFSNFDTSGLDSNVVLKVFDKGDIGHLVTITDIVDEHSIRVDKDLSEWIGSIDESGNVVAGNQLFVYGQQVDDFVLLNKDAIWTIATAALQEVDRQLQAEKEKVKSLEERLAALEAIVLNQ